MEDDISEADEREQLSRLTKGLSNKIEDDDLLLHVRELQSRRITCRRTRS